MSRVALVVFVAYAVFVAWASLSTPAEVPPVGPYDKLVHLGVYGLFAVLGWGLRLGRGQYVFLCLGLVAYGAAMEFGQSFVPGRMMSGMDMVANAAGIAIGAVSCLLPGIYREQRGEQ